MLESLPYDLSRLRISPTDFITQSFMHGMGHTLRVSIFSAWIGEQTGYVREGRISSVAALFHDMARADDGIDHLHGRIAADTVVPRFSGYIKTLGFTDSDINEIKCAIEWHSLPEELPLEHQFSISSWILKDADALDRIRLKDLDIQYLRFNESKELVPKIYRFYRLMVQCIPLLLSDTDRITEAARYVEEWIYDNSGFDELLERLQQFQKSTTRQMTALLESPQLYELVIRQISAIDNNVNDRL